MLKKLLFILAFTLLSTTAMAESINGRVGVTGKFGFITPLQDLTAVGEANVKVDTGLVGGGGLIYGYNDNLAFDFEVTLAPSCSVTSNSNLGDLQTTDISLGLQYRFMTDRHIVPYVGAGLDFIKGDIAQSTINWSYGGHVNAGVDYFVTKNIAVTADIKYVVGTESDIDRNGVILGKYNPMSFIGTIGVRLFLPENIFN